MKSGNSSRGGVHVSEASGVDAQLVEQLQFLPQLGASDISAEQTAIALAPASNT